ncbi:MAG: cupin domain-containing protein [Rhodospirillaceae bacterium]|jgi:quercetin dioxygenase-like cupin family protein
MAFSVRRVVTGHDENNKAIVVIDEETTNGVTKRPGQHSTVVWATDRETPDLVELNDISHDVQQTTVPHGSVCRISRFDPGVSPRMHRTESIDYAIILSGELDMELDYGKITKLKAGDVVVQRGTMHNWQNNGTEPCYVAFILISAPLPEGLNAEG